MQLFMTSVSSGVSSIEYLKNNINSETKLVILPFAHHFDYLSCAEDVYNHYDRNPFNKESIFWKTVRPFIDIGINPDRISVINHFDDPINLIKHKLLDDNTIIYYPGGFPENIVKIVRDLKIVNEVKQSKIVVGESAGSMFWSRKFFVYKDPDYPKYKCFRGIKLIKNFSVIPHYNDDNVDQAINVLDATFKFKKFHREKVFLMRDGGYVWYDSDINKVVKFENCIVID